MRPALVLIITSIVVATSVAASAAVPSTAAQPVAPGSLSAPIFILSGGGYGHGVGLNQYGARGLALANRGYSDILSFYYPGTAIATSPTTKVRVLVAEARPQVSVGSTAPFTVTEISGVVTQIPAGEITLKRDLAIVLDGTKTPLVGPLTFAPGRGSTLTLDGKGYRGVLQMTPVKTALQVINIVGLDAYLLGVVPGEMPKEWPAAALQAQAVAARSYTLASLVKNRPFDVYSDTRSQVYYGVSYESPSTTAAVKATRGQILTYGGKVATTFYYSSSGGRTASSEDVFGIVTPYLQAKDDPWDVLSPYHQWPVKTFTAATLAQAFGLSGPVVDVATVQTPSGRPLTVTLVKQSGARVELRAADVRARLGLRSTAFRLGVLRIGRPGPPALPGTAVAVTGLAREVDVPMLEKLAQNGLWIPAVKLKPADDGSFSVIVKPKVTATYRLTAAGQIGPAVTITVAPEVAA